MKKEKKFNVIGVIGLRAYPPQFTSVSGVETYTEYLLKKIDKKWKFVFFSRERSRKEIKNQRYNVKIVPHIKQKTLEPITSSLIASFWSIFTPVKVIWYHGAGPGFFAFIPKLFGKKIILTVHSEDWKREKWSGVEKKLFSFLAQRAISFADVVTTVSHNLRNSEYLKNITDVVVIRHHLHKVSPKKSGSILYMGRIVPEKRLEWLIQAYREVHTNNNLPPLIIVGAHTYSSEYFKQLKQLSEGSSIEWRKPVFGKRKERYLKEARFLVVPSSLEGFPMVVGEASKFGVTTLLAKEFIDKDLQKHPLIRVFKVDSYSSFKNAFKKMLLTF